MMTFLVLLLPFLSPAGPRVAAVLPPAAPDRVCSACGAAAAGHNPPLDWAHTRGWTSVPAQLWACDGCSFTGTEREVCAHVDAGLRTPTGTLREIADVTCFGAYEVGGPAWEAHVFHGVHPMSVLAQDVRALGGAA